MPRYAMTGGDVIERRFCSNKCQGISVGAVNAAKSRAMRSARKAIEGYRVPEHQRIRTSKEYDAWRQAVMQRDNWACRQCGRRGCRLHAHHIKPFATHPQERFEVSNGETLCPECHAGVHRRPQLASR